MYYELSKKFIATGFALFVVFLPVNFTFADDVNAYVKVIHDGSAIVEDPNAADLKTLDTAKIGWIIHVTGLKIATDGSEWYEVFQIDNDDTGFWYAYRMYELPGVEPFIRKQDVESIPDPLE
jgi:hypothetical protein